MHRALLVNEILWTTVQQLDVSDRYTLYALAITNRAWSEVALDALWVEPSLCDLARCMDKRIWQTAMSSTGTLTLNMRAGVSYTSLGDRFLAYAKRVRALGLCRYSARPSRENQAFPLLDVSPAVVLVWANSRPERLFPKLQKLTLEWRYSTSDWQYSSSRGLYPKPILSFITSSVTAVSLEWPGNISPDNEELDRLRRVCKNMRHVSFRTNMDDTSAVDQLISVLVTASARLRSAVIRVPLTIHDVLHLSSLNLISLDIQLRDEDEPAPALPAYAFAHLETLDLTDKNGSSASFRLFLSMQPNGRLRALNYTNQEIFHDFPCLNLVLEHVAGWTTLYHVALTVNTQAEPVSSEQHQALFSRLCALPNLKHLHIGWTADVRGMEYSSIVCDVLRVCTSLERWTLYSDSRPYYTIVSFRRFLDILRAHPRVSTLPLCVRVSDLPPLHEMSGFVHRSYGRSLHVDEIQDPAELAALCKAVLPSVQTCTERNFFGWGKDWKKVGEVNRLLKGAEGNVVDSEDEDEEKDKDEYKDKDEDNDENEYPDHEWAGGEDTDLE